jgi:hypothetical protein
MTWGPSNRYGMSAWERDTIRSRIWRKVERDSDCADTLLPRYLNRNSLGFVAPPYPIHGAEAPRGPCRRSGDPLRFFWEGKLELTEALLEQPRFSCFYLLSPARLEGMWTEAFDMASAISQ